MRYLRGGLFNRLDEHSVMPEPSVGMGATQILYTDRHAGTIVEVERNSAGAVVAFIWQSDTAKRTDKNGMSETQTYEYAPNPNAPKVKVSLRRNGCWVTHGESTAFLVGNRSEYHDYSF